MGFTIKANDDELQALYDYLHQMNADNSLTDFLELRIEAPDLDTVYMTFDMHERLTGNPTLRTLHGGVIATVMDLVGANVTFQHVFKMFKGAPFEKQLEQFSKVGTIDLRVDYLQPGRGERFKAKGWALRAGNKVVVARMELHNEKSVLIAVGTGAYSIG